MAAWPPGSERCATLLLWAGGVILGVLVVGSFIYPGRPGAIPSRGTWDWLIPTIEIGYGAACLVTGFGLRRRASWAGYAAVALAGISLLAIPVGTVFGVVIFRRLFKDPDG